MSSLRRPRPGTVVRIDLPDGHAAFGRVLRDASVAVYRGIYGRADQPPLGSRDFAFVVGIYDRDLSALPVTGFDPGTEDEDAQQTVQLVKDAGRASILPDLSWIFPARPCRSAEQ